MVPMRLWIISIFWIIAVACSVNQEAEDVKLPFYNQADFTPEWINEEDSNYNQIHKIADFQFINQDSIIVTNQTFEGNIYVADFFFTICPSICPKMTSNLDIVHKEFKNRDDVMILSHSVMPWVDSVSVLKKYAIDKGVDSERWHFVTGDKNEIYDLARSSYFAEKEIGLLKENDAFLHTENFILVDKKGRIRGVYNGTLPLEMKRLITDIKTLLKLD
jgi:protein SCO1/2